MTNAAAIGYMILAAKMLPLTKLQIEQMESLMNIVMDENTEEEAQNAYLNN